MSVNYPDLDAIVVQRLRAVLEEDVPDDVKARHALWALFWWRGATVARRYMAEQGAYAHAGIFKGMKWPERTMPGKVLPILLGTHESALQPEIAKLDERNYRQVINIGCSVGDYAVGLALRWPQCKILAHDVDEVALEWAREIAALNGVTDRVIFGGLLDHQSLDAAIAPRTLVLCDIEGAEEALLDPVQVPKLASADIVVEIHELYSPGLSKRLLSRFAESHELTLVDRWQSELTDDPYFKDKADLDRLVATMELRDGPTPWAVLRSKNYGS